MEISSTAVTIFKWRIEKFSKTASRNDPTKELISPYFELNRDVKLLLVFHPTSIQPDGDKDYCSVYLYAKVVGKGKSVNLDYFLWLENIDGERLGQSTKATSHTFTDLPSGYGFSNFANNSKLYGREASFVKNDVVFVCCEIKSIPLLTEIPPPLESELRQKLYSFYEQSSIDNCTIQVGKRSFNGSKAILVAQSSVFDRMFMSGMQEARENKMAIENVSPEIMACFIEYLYLGKLNNLKDLAKDLFILADKYDVSRLKEECIESLLSSFTKDNILERLHLAFRYNNSDLKETVLAYVCDKTSDSNINYIMKTEAWTKLVIEDKQLADEITDAVFLSIY